MRPTPGILLATSLALLAGGCLYGFKGGGLPPEIKTVAVLPFDNLTPEPTLTQEVSDSVRSAVQRRLGLRQAGETTADAVVRGTIMRYQPDVPVAYTGAASGTSNEVNVTRRLVQLTVSVEILTREGKAVWQRSSMMLEGDYEPGQETEADARGRALSKLVTNIVDGAQSQW
ncbi:MAG: LPS assembly lipoprotein LptE [Gemmatimonadota bacterium]|nr:LPS assembly lipoprotein LptE [Gemmatimonadota bacterium]MDH5284413.1 LPS assembly lipoprotein LptE [Gemmatimonadota bacterium]